jgi:hypothetical protein
MTVSVIVRIVAALGFAAGWFLIKVIAVLLGAAVAVAAPIGLLMFRFLPNRRKEEPVKRSQ